MLTPPSVFSLLSPFSRIKNTRAATLCIGLKVRYYAIVVVACRPIKLTLSPTPYTAAHIIISKHYPPHPPLVLGGSVSALFSNGQLSDRLFHRGQWPS